MPRFEVDYGRAVIPEGFFLLRRPPPPQKPGAYADIAGSFFRHLSTFPGHSTIKEAVLALLSRAKRHVLFCNFLLQDDDVLKAMVEAAIRLHGHVYVLTTLKAQDFNQEGSENGGAEGDFESHMCCIKQLTAQGLLVKARSDCHAKFMTVDDAEAIVTSANAVPTCYGDTPKSHGGVREANVENGVLFSIPSEVRRLANFFRAIWRNAYNYYVAPDPTVFEVQQLHAGTRPIQSAEPPIPHDDGQVLWTAPADTRLRDRFVEMVQRAHESVCLSTWVIKGMDDHVLGDAMKQAAARDVRFQILVRGMRRNDHRRQCYLLARALGERAHIFGDYWNHSKAMVVDSREALVLTANMDAQHGLDQGVEVGFYSQQQPFIAAVSGFLYRATAAAAFELVADPTQATIAERYGRRSGLLLEGVVHIRFQAKGERTTKLVRRWCDAARQELVCVARRKKEERSEYLLRTNRMVICATPGDGDTLNAHSIEDRPSAEDLDRFDSYLGKATILCDVESESG